MKLERDAEAAHEFCSNNKPALEKDKICGCFYCETIFDPKEIEEWVIADNSIDYLGTAICPHCGIDAVIGESSGFPVTKEFLHQMHLQWFA